MRQRLEQKSTYWLARDWIGRTRSQAKWEASGKVLGMLVRGIVNRKATRLDRVADALFSRFDGVFEQALAAGHCPEHRFRMETTRCLVELQNVVNADPKAWCLPELMWKVAARHWPIMDKAVGVRVRHRFHLMALIDELPSSDERGALRDYVFGSREGAADTYSSKRKREVEDGIEILAQFLNETRDKVEKLTAGAIPSGLLLTVEDAQDLVMTNIGIKARRGTR